MQLIDITRIMKNGKLMFTSKTLSNISTVNGNSSLIATVALKVFLDSLHKCSLPKHGGSPAEELI